MRHDSFTCATWRHYVCNVPHWRARHDSLISRTRLYATTDNLGAYNLVRLMHESCRARLLFLYATCLIDVSHSCVQHDSFTCVTWLIHMCDMTHSHVLHHSLRCVTYAKQTCAYATHSCTKKLMQTDARTQMIYVRATVSTNIWMSWSMNEPCHLNEYVTHELTHMCYMALSLVRHDSFICATWLIHMCSLALSRVRHDSFVCATWLIHVCDMTRSHVLHGSFTCATWRIHVCDMTHSHVTYELTKTNTCTRTESHMTPSQTWRLFHTWSHVTHMNKSRMNSQRTTPAHEMSHLWKGLCQIWMRLCHMKKPCHAHE